MLVSIIIPYIRGEKAYDLADSLSGLTGAKDFSTWLRPDKTRIGCPKMVKILTDQCNSDLVCFLGDDSLPQKNFLKEAIHCMSLMHEGWGLVGFNDRTGRTLPTHWLAHKKLLPHLGGEFFHTGYKHCYCDNELQTRAMEIGRYRWCEKAVVLHDHPLINGAAYDEDYKRVYSQEYLRHDAELFQKRLKAGFPNE